MLPRAGAIREDLDAVLGQRQVLRVQRRPTHRSVHVLVPEVRLASHEKVAGFLVLALVIERDRRHRSRLYALGSNARYGAVQSPRRPLSASPHTDRSSLAGFSARPGLNAEHELPTLLPSQSAVQTARPDTRFLRAPGHSFRSSARAPLRRRMKLGSEVAVEKVKASESLYRPAHKEETKQAGLHAPLTHGRSPERCIDDAQPHRWHLWRQRAAERPQGESRGRGPAHARRRAG
jgi:hypothetical protein